MSKSATSSSGLNVGESEARKAHDWTKPLIVQAHAEVDQIRKEKGLPPWDWSKPKKTDGVKPWLSQSMAQQLRRERERAAKEARRLEKEQSAQSLRGEGLRGMQGNRQSSSRKQEAPSRVSPAKLAKAAVWGKDI